MGGSGKYYITLMPNCCPYLGTLQSKLQSLKGNKGEGRRTGTVWVQTLTLCPSQAQVKLSEYRFDHITNLLWERRIQLSLNSSSLCLYQKCFSGQWPPVHKCSLAKVLSFMCCYFDFYVLLLLVSQGSNEVSVSVLLTKALKINHAWIKTKIIFFSTVLCVQTNSSHPSFGLTHLPRCLIQELRLRRETINPF